uniref:flavin monoamine oxidase family protein n=1 Tax=Mycobacteroides chelonae TaxID=1774 RepID=UPI00099214A4
MLKKAATAIVVGGGLAGVTAARDLALAGVHTTLFEARDRLGGRTAVQTLAGRPVDTGGAYFHWFQSAIWREVMRYELPVVESGLLTAERYMLGTADGILTVPPEEFEGRLRRGLAAFVGDPSYMELLARPFAFHTNPEIARLDAMSVEDRIQQLDLDPKDEQFLRGMLADFGTHASLAWVLQRMANGVWSYEAILSLFAAYRLEAGMTTLIEAMVREGGFDVRLSAPVTAIDRDNTGARVTLADGSTSTADLVVLATPVSVWKTISFTPALSEAHQTATTEGVVAPNVNQMLMHVRGVPEPVGMFALPDTLAFELVGTHSMIEDGQLLHGFAFYGGISCAAGHAKIEEELRRILPQAELVDYVGHDWSTDPYSLGGHCSLNPGQGVRFLDVLDQPQDRLFVASADIWR